MKKEFVFGYVTLDKNFYWDGERFTGNEFLAKRYATRPGIKRAVSFLKNRGIIPYRKYFVDEVEDDKG